MECLGLDQLRNVEDLVPVLGSKPLSTGSGRVYLGGIGDAGQDGTRKSPGGSFQMGLLRRLHPIVRQTPDHGGQTQETRTSVPVRG